MGYAVQIREISTAELAERARLWNATRPPSEPVAAALAQLKRTGCLNSRTWSMLERRQAESKPQLRALFQSTDPGNVEFRIGLASHLAKMQVPDAHDYIVAQLQNPDPRLRWLALLNWDVKIFPPKNAAEMDLLLSLARDPDPHTRAEAVSRCSNLDDNIAAPVLTHAFEDPAFRNRGWLLLWFLRHKGIEKYFDRAVEFLPSSTSGNDTDWAVCAQCEIIEKGPADLSGRARALLEEFFVNSTNKHRLAQGIVRMLARIAGASTLPALQTVFEQASDRVSQSEALTAIARISPTLALKLLSTRIDYVFFGGSFLAAFAGSASAEDWRSLVALALNALAAKLEHFYLSEGIMELLIDRGGDAGRAAVKREIPNIGAKRKMRALWQLNGWTIPNVLQDMRQRGIIDSIPDPSLIEKVREKWCWPKADAAILHDVLREAGILRDIWAQADEPPADHSDLLAAFSKITNGIFAPQYCRQIPIKKRLEGDSEESDLLAVSFVADGILFEYEASDLGTEFDLNPAFGAVDTALEWTPQPKRLIHAFSEDELNLYFWGEPGSVREFCRAWAIPLVGETM